MERILRASVASGTTSVPLFFFVCFARNMEPFELSPNLLAGVLLCAGFLWIVGALCASVLLIPLIPITDRVRSPYSIVLFLAFGFSVPAWLMYQFLHIGAHGNPPPIETKPWGDLMLSITSLGLIGAGAAMAAWLSVKKTVPPQAGSGQLIEVKTENA